MKNIKLRLKTGDLVKVITGNSKGQQGQILQIDKAKQRAVVEKINMQTHYIKPDQQNPKGGIQKKEGFIHISNLMLIDPSTQQPTRIGRKKNEKGKLQRYAKKTGKEL